MKKVIFLFINLAIPFIIYSQINIEFDTYHPDNSVHQVATYSEALLENGVTYTIQVEGNFSPWGSNVWTNPCGTPEDSPIYASTTGEPTGSVGHDFVFNYGLPNTGSCNNNPNLPQTTNVFNVSIDGGNNWFLPTVNEGYNSEHIYTFEIIGEGQLFMVKNLDQHSSDNYGKFLFEIKSRATSAIADESKKITGLEVYPNPVERELNIDFQNKEFNGKVFIYNSAGILMKEIEAQNQTTIDMSDLSSGIYFLKFIEEKTKKWDIQKVVKLDYRA